MTTRVQVILDEQEREAFRRQAEREGESLSSWLRRAGRERLASHAAPAIDSARALRAFFTASNAAEPGREPDWAEHEAVIEASIRSGGAR